MPIEGTRPLTNQRHERFAQTLVQGASATEAYLAAGYRCTREAARRRGSKLLTKADVSARIGALKATAATRAEFDAEWVLRRLKLIADASVADYRIGKGGVVEVLGDRAPEAIKAVVSVKRSTTVDASGRETVRTDLRLVDKVRALELLGKHLGLWDRERATGDPIVVQVVGPPRTT